MLPAPMATPPAHFVGGTAPAWWVTSKPSPPPSPSAPAAFTSPDATAPKISVTSKCSRWATNARTCCFYETTNGDRIGIMLTKAAQEGVIAACRQFGLSAGHLEKIAINVIRSFQGIPKSLGGLGSQEAAFSKAMDAVPWYPSQLHAARVHGNVPHYHNPKPTIGTQLGHRDVVENYNLVREGGTPHPLPPTPREPLTPWW